MNAIEVENLSKMYRLGLVGTGTLTHDLNVFISKMRGKGDPYAKIAQSNKREEKSEGKYVWAVQNINFEVPEGEVFGIIGKNGAGKSTLLKLLARVTGPTTGEVRARGRIASLLEVGTGFHPELTGRENIYLNGAILGMTRAEIRKKFDEIVDFSGVERYIDTPVKRYSSGMHVRLAFAVAAHLEPEILIVDEVLAVGDAEFQRKCIGKMQDVSTNSGRTVLFVSHNMAAVKNLCTRVMVLKHGETSLIGSPQEAIEHYLSREQSLGINGEIPEGLSSLNTGEARFTSIRMVDENNEAIEEVYYQSPMTFEIQVKIEEVLKDVVFDLRVKTKDDLNLAYAMTSADGSKPMTLQPGVYNCRATLSNHLQPGSYSVTIGIHYTDGRTVDFVENVSDFRVMNVGEGGRIGQVYAWDQGYTLSESKWTLEAKSN